MSLSNEQLTQISEATAAGVKSALSDLKVEPKQHFEDHGFVFKVRGGLKTIIKGFLLLMGGGLATLAGIAIKGWVAG